LCSLQNSIQPIGARALAPSDTNSGLSLRALADDAVSMAKSATAASPAHQRLVLLLLVLQLPPLLRLLLLLSENISRSPFPVGEATFRTKLLYRR
jgi:hypothetical protein